MDVRLLRVYRYKSKVERKFEVLKTWIDGLRKGNLKNYFRVLGLRGRDGQTKRKTQETGVITVLVTSPLIWSSNR